MNAKASIGCFSKFEIPHSFALPLHQLTEMINVYPPIFVLPYTHFILCNLNYLWQMKQHSVTKY